MNKDSFGFTLVELLVSISLLALVVIAATNIFFTSIKTSQKTDVHTTIKEDGNYALNFIVDQIRQAQRAACAVGSLTLTDASGSTTFSISNDRLVAGASRYLTGPDFRASGFSSTCDPPPPSPPENVRKVKIAFILTEVNGTETERFETTVSLRNY